MSDDTSTFTIPAWPGPKDRPREGWAEAITMKPPDVTFTLVGGREIFATPAGATIHITLAEGGQASDMIIRDADDVVVLDALVRHRDDVVYQQDNLAVYVAERACAFYWSMWRREQLRLLEEPHDDSPEVRDLQGTPVQ